MKRYPLLIQLIVYIFLLVLLLLGFVGSLYYQTSSGTIRQLTERTTRNSMEQSGQFIALLSLGERPPRLCMDTVVLHVRKCRLLLKS